MSKKNAALRSAAGIVSLVALGVCLALVLGAGNAGAHGVQVTSDPPPNAELTETPELISITFSEPIEPSVSTIQLWDQAAQPVELGPLEFFDDPKRMAAHVPGDLPAGIYTVVWRNLSTVDGHTWSGSFPFTILGAGGEAPTGEAAAPAGGLSETPSDNPSSLESAARWVVLLGSAVMLGGTAYVLFVAAPAGQVLSPATGAVLRGLSRTVLLITAAIGIFLVLEGSLLQLVVQADDLGGLGHADELLVDTRLGHYLLARQALLAVALLAVGLVWWARARRWETPALGLLLAASMGVLLTQSLVSHAAASDGPFWTTTIDVLHLLAASLWVGGLIHVGLAMPRWLDELKGPARTLFAAESFRRFSLLAGASVVVLLSSGVLSALVQFTSWDELWSTSYGWSLVGKLAAMLPLLGVAGLNAFILRPQVVDAGLHLAGGAEAGFGEGAAPAVSPDASGRLATTVRAEAALGIVVLVAVAVLIQLQSPRTTAEAEEQVAAAAEETEYLEEAEAGGLDFALRIEPAQVGDNSFELELDAPSGPVGEVLQARLEFDHPQEDVGGTRVVLDPAQEEQEAFQDGTEVEGLIMGLRIEPARVGENTFELRLGSELGFIGEVTEAYLDVDGPANSARLPLTLSGSQRYQAEGELSEPGDWTVTATVRRRVEEDVQASFDVPVEDPDAARVYAAEGSYLSLPGDWTVTATVRRRGEDDVRVSFEVPVKDPNAPVEAESGSLWQWPFEGARSAGAIAVLAVVGAGALGWGAWRVVQRRAGLG